MSDYDLKDWLQIGTMLLSIGSVFYVWLNAGGKRAQSALEVFKTETAGKMTQEAADIVGLERRMQKIEDMLPHLPDRGDFHKLELSMTRQESRLEALVDKFQVYSGTVTRLDEYMREHNK